MEHMPSSNLVPALTEIGVKKSKIPPVAMLLSGFLSGALLAYATALALKTSDGLSRGPASLVAAFVFPVGFAMIVLLGLELVTGNFAVLPIAAARGRIGMRDVLRNWVYVYIGNLAGSVFVGLLLTIAMTEAFTQPAGPLGDRIVALALAKTETYAHAGAWGWVTALVKGILCNWMVAIGTVLAVTGRSTTGKIIATWLPIMTFFALAFEHSVVNMFVMPTAHFLGGRPSVWHWLAWNQVPVTIGNIIGGALLTGLLLHWIDRTGVVAKGPGSSDVIPTTS